MDEAFLDDAGLRRVSGTPVDIAELGESALASLVGAAMGRRLYALSRNVDEREVAPGLRRQSAGAQRALGRADSAMSPVRLDAVVVNLVDRITARLRAAGRTVVLRLRFDGIGRATRSRTLASPTSATQPVLAAERGLTPIGFAVSGIDGGGAQQLMLPFTGTGSPSTRRSTRCAAATADPHSPRRCCSAARPAWRRRTYPTEPAHSSSSFADQVLTIRSTDTPASSARWAP